MRIKSLLFDIVSRLSAESAALSLFLSFRPLLLSDALTRVKVLGIQVTEKRLMSAFNRASTLKRHVLYVFVALFSVGASAADLLQYRAFATQQNNSTGLYGRSSDFQTVHSVSLDSQRTYNQHGLQFAAASWLTLQSGADRIDSKVSEAWWGYDVGNGW